MMEEERASRSFLLGAGSAALAARVGMNACSLRWACVCGGGGGVRVRSARMRAALGRDRGTPRDQGVFRSGAITSTTTIILPLSLSWLLPLSFYHYHYPGYTVLSRVVAVAVAAVAGDYPDRFRADGLASEGRGQVVVASAHWIPRHDLEDVNLNG